VPDRSADVIWNRLMSDYEVTLVNDSSKSVSAYHQLERAGLVP